MTGQTETIARPYALAAFEYALAHNELPVWEKMLQAAATMATDKQMQILFSNISVTSQKLLELFLEILAPLLDEPRKNFLKLIAEHKRFNVLPDIFLKFKIYKEEQEKIIPIEIISAVALEGNFLKKIADAISLRVKQKVTTQCTVDPQLLGGVMVRMGDKVIDGSIRGKLNRLLESI